ncbi:MAG: small-conductance mechanosensitive channel [Paraglaciecola sp.]|jgi:small-conductance mechanosensitive channel
MLTINGIPFSMLFVLTILGWAIFATFSLYKRLILPIILLKDNGQAHRKSVARLEIIVWAIFFLSLVYYALVASLPVTVILLTLIIFAFFDFWRNYFTGIIMKLGDKIQLGDSVVVNGHSGKIVEFGNRDIKMESTIGEEILIPYRLANTEIKIGQKSKPKILFKTFVLDENIKTSSTELKQKIEQAIYTNPWIIISSPVTISMEGQKATLNFYVLNNDFFEKARRKLLQDLR